MAGTDSGPRAPSWLLAAGTVLVGLLFVELASHAVIVLLEGRSPFVFIPVRDRLEAQTRAVERLLARDDSRLLQLDPELGFVYGPNGRTALYSSNSLGARGRREYATMPPAGTRRIVAFGDSFLHGNEVADEEVWSAALEGLDPALEVLNFGVGGYGVDQALLYQRRQLRRLEAHVLIVGISEVMYARNLNRYRRFLSPADLPLFKPRFVLDSRGRLALIPNPMAGREGAERLRGDPWQILGVAERDWFFEPLVWRNPLYDRFDFVRLVSTILSKSLQSRIRSDRLYRGDSFNEASEAFQLLVALVREFSRDAERADQQLLVLLFPTRPSDIWGGGRPTYAPLLEALPDISFIDPAPVLARRFEHQRAALFASGGHYSPAAHSVVARVVHAFVSNRNPSASP